MVSITYRVADLELIGKMKLQRHIRRILREEHISPITVIRRINFVEEYINELVPREVCRHWVRDEVKEYVSGTMKEIVRTMIDTFLDIKSEIYNEVFDETYDILIDLGYEKKVRDFFLESMDNCRKNIQESEGKKLPSFFTRRVDHHKFEKMMRKGIPYIFHDSNSLQEFKYKLVEATLENYIHDKYDINIDELPQEDKDTFIQYMIDVYDPVLTAYYRNYYKR